MLVEFFECNICATGYDFRERRTDQLKEFIVRNETVLVQECFEVRFHKSFERNFERNFHNSFKIALRSNVHERGEAAGGRSGHLLEVVEMTIVREPFKSSHQGKISHKPWAYGKVLHHY